MKLEPIIKARLDKFCQINEFQGFSESKLFEYFVNYHVLYAEQPDLFFGNSDILDVVSTGGHNDMSIDGIAIKADGRIITSAEDYDAIISKNKKFQIEFIFIQSKYKPKVDMGEFNNFAFGIREFLSNDKPTQPYNSNISYLLDLKNYVLKDDYISLWKENPSVEIHYVTIGENKSLPHVNALSERLREDIKYLNIYDEILINLIDSKDLKLLVDSNENSFDVTFNFIENMGLNEVDCVDNSCVVLCFGNEFLRIIINDNGSLRKTIFNDNVRDFQGDTNINNEIRKTIECEPEKFVLLNNGVTIVADRFVPRNRTIMLSNPQIVNGCQSSSVIYHAYKQGYDISKVPVLVKIIATTDSQVANQIVRGTNRQNIVYDEAFEITREFHKNLEEFFESQPWGDIKYYYERRSRQFQHNPTIKQWQKISFKNIIQGTIGTFLYRPDMAHMHESKLLKAFQNKIFLDNHSLFPYYTAGILNSYLENYFRNSNNSRKDYYQYKYHILMISNLLVNNSDRFSLNNEKDVDNQCKLLLNALLNNNTKLFDQSIKSFESCKQIWINEYRKSQHGIKDIHDFVEVIIKTTATHKQQDEAGDSKFYGRVVKVSIDKHGNYFGFLEHKPTDLFFHQQQNRDVDFKNLLGNFVSYEMGKNRYNNNDIAINLCVQSAQ